MIFTIYGIWSAFSQQTKRTELSPREPGWRKHREAPEPNLAGGFSNTEERANDHPKKVWIWWIYYRQKRSACLVSYDGCTVMYGGSWPRKRRMYITQVTWCPTFFLQISVYNNFATFAGILDIPIFCWLIKLITLSCDLIPSCCWNNSQSKPHLLMALGP